MPPAVTSGGRRLLATVLLLPPILAVGGFAPPRVEAHPGSPRQAGTASAEPRVIDVIAKRYAFEPAEIEVTEGERVRLLVKSGDGLHGFEIRRFKVSKEIPRGADPIAIDFTASEAGRFPILCSVFCGDGHDDMRGTLVVTARAAAQP